MIDMASKKNGYIGIYIDYNNITISHVDIKNKKLFFKKLSNIAVDYKIEGLIKPLSINSDFFNEKQQWVGTFKETLKKLKSETNSVIVSLSHNFSITRFFTMPFIERRFWNKAVPIESKKHIPVAFDEFGYDFYVNTIGEKLKLAVLFSVTQKKTTEFLSQIIKESGFALEIVEPAAHSYYRFSEYLTDGKDSYIFIYEKDDEVYTSIIWNKIPVLYRYTSFAKSSFSERRSLDLKGSIMFLQRNIPNADIKDVYICGENPEFSISQVKREIQIEPKVIDFKNIFDLTNITFGVIISSAASLNDKIKTDYIIDISENQKSKKSQDIVKKFAFIFTSIVTTFFIFLYLINIFKIYLNNNKITKYYSQMTEISEFENSPSALVEDKVKQMSRIAKVMKNIFQNKDLFTPKLLAIADTIPKDVWLKTVSYVNSPSIDPSLSSTIDMIIEGETYLVGDSKTYYLDYFIKELKKKKAFEIFNPPNGRIDYETRDPENILHFSSVNASQDYRSLISKIKITANAKK